jgi:multicomponent Na+:H+ antiporter subunit E
MDREDRYAFPLILTWRLLPYWVWLIKEIFWANVAVAKVILDPKLPISPIIVPFKACAESDLGRMIYANSITLTPGTITTGTDGEILRIHALTWHDVDGREEDEMGHRVCALEGRGERRKGGGKT